MSLYRRHVKDLRKVSSGPEHVGECPFKECNDNSKMKFFVNVESGLYHCKICGASGNAITFAKFFGEDSQSYYDQPPSPTNIDLKKIAHYHKNLLSR